MTNETQRTITTHHAQMEADVVNRAIALRDAIRAHSKAAIVIPLEVRKAMDELVAAVDGRSHPPVWERHRG
jgi:hypothetical protein